MPQDVPPPVKLVKGPCKHVLTEKAREAAEVPLRHVKPWPATMKLSASALTVHEPAASAMLMTTTVSVPVSIPESIPKRVPICSSDYTDDDYNWGTDQ